MEHWRVIGTNRSDSFSVVFTVFVPLGDVIVTPLFLQPIKHLLILIVDAPFIR